RTRVFPLFLHDALPISNGCSGSGKAESARSQTTAAEQSARQPATTLEAAEHAKEEAEAEAEQAQNVRNKLLSVPTQHRRRKNSRDRKSTRLNSSHEWIS